MAESMEWWFKHDSGNVIVNPTHLTYPEILCVTVLPKHIKERVTAKFNEYQKNSDNIKIINSLEYIKNLMNSKDDSHLLPQLQTYLEGTDAYRDQDFYKSYPHFADIFRNQEEV
jgi:hypothetical protein